MKSVAMAFAMLLLGCGAMAQDYEVLDWSSMSCSEPNTITKASLCTAANTAAHNDSVFEARPFWDRCAIVLETLLLQLESYLDKKHDPLGRNYDYMFIYEGRGWEFWEGLALDAQSIEGLIHPELVSPDAMRFLVEFRNVFEPLIEPGDPSAHLFDQQGD
jgi:hypothetical protein